MGEVKERWKTLCQRAINEEDPEKFVVAIEELIQELETKEKEKDQQLKRSSLPRRM